MIAALRRNRRDDKQRWSDADIRRVLGLSRTQFQRALEARAREPFSWTQDSLARAVLDWALRERRWPTSGELDKREGGLPARSSLASHWHQDWQPNALTPFAQLQRYIVQDAEHFQRLTPALILTIRNVTVRREAMLKYGIDKLLEEGGGERVQQDDYGVLWRLPSDNRMDDHAQWVEVENTTPEPDGSHARHFIRVPPHIQTAAEGVAWSFDTTVQELNIKQAS